MGFVCSPAGQIQALCIRPNEYSSESTIVIEAVSRTEPDSVSEQAKEVDLQSELASYISVKDQ